MCLTPNIPDPKEPDPPPTERDAQLEGLEERQRAAGRPGLRSTILTSPQGVVGSVGTRRKTLGGQ